MGLEPKPWRLLQNRSPPRLHCCLQRQEPRRRAQGGRQCWTPTLPHSFSAQLGPEGGLSDGARCFPLGHPPCSTPALTPQETKNPREEVAHLAGKAPFPVLLFWAGWGHPQEDGGIRRGHLGSRAPRTPCADGQALWPAASPPLLRWGWGEENPVSTDTVSLAHPCPPRPREFIGHVLYSSSKTRAITSLSWGFMAKEGTRDVPLDSGPLNGGLFALFLDWDTVPSALLSHPGLLLLPAPAGSQARGCKDEPSEAERRQ